MARITGKLAEILFSVIDGENTVEKIRKRSIVVAKHSTIIEHLGKLERMGILHGEKRGRERLYSVDWERLIDEFASEFAYAENFVTEAFLHNTPSYTQIVGKKLTYMSPLIVRRYDDIKYLRERPNLISKAEKVVKENKLVRNFIKDYMQSYAQWIWLETNTSLSGCVITFIDRFVMLVDRNKNIQRLLESRTNDSEQRQFLSFLKYLTNHAFVVSLNDVVITGAMEQYLITHLKPGDLTR